MNALPEDRNPYTSVSPKKLYEKPKVITFGTVAELTMTGGTEHLPDHRMTTRKHHPTR